MCCAISKFRFILRIVTTFYGTGYLCTGRLPLGWNALEYKIMLIHGIPVKVIRVLYDINSVLVGFYCSKLLSLMQSSHVVNPLSIQTAICST